MEWGWLTVAVAVPLAFNPWGASAFELPKVALLRALVILMGLAAVIHALESIDGSDRPRRDWVSNPLLWTAVTLGLALTLAALVSVEPRASFWGSYERQQGLITLWAYLGLFLLTATGLRTRAQGERLWLALVWGSVPVVAYGLLQAMGLDPLEWRTDAASAVLSTVGRANFLGSYLVLVIPLTMGRMLLSRRRWPYVALVAGQVLCLAFTQARGAWVGVGAGMVVFGLGWARINRRSKVGVATLVAAALLVGAVAMLNWSSGPLSYLKDVPGLDRVATLTRTDEGSTAARLTTWRAALPLIRERPCLGYGPETMWTVFSRVFPPQLVYYQGRNAIVDRAHNVWLDLGMSAGAAGVVAFSALLALFGWGVWRGMRCASDQWEQVAWVSLGAAVAGHLIDLQFGFDLTASATVLWLTLALGAALGRGLSSSISRGGDSLEATSLIPYLPPAVVAVALGGLLCLRPLLADMAYWESLQASPSLEQRRIAAARAVALWSLEPEYRLGAASSLLEGGDFAAAEGQMEAARRLSPNDPGVWALWGDMCAQWGEVDPKGYAEAERAYRRALALAPNVATFHKGLGLVLAGQGRLQEGMMSLERAVALDGTDPVAYGHLADVYLSVGREAEGAWAREQEAWWNGRAGDHGER
ncbi:MAG: tetratricopeptide repeat protein [Anaerolineae bacterium]|nr:tetratricopeptide repeat protein [Anaerolineae bacterium]NIN97939.1 tetratricopeptide repeat protein [Anaerolineae bacterium]NIQ80906.1 tetratricopeptide repeat protein [Anaerolineae bacterium]